MQPARQAAHAARRLAVAGEQNAIVAAPKFIFRQAIPLGAFFDEQDEVGGAFADLNIFRLDDGRHRVTAFPSWCNRRGRRRRPKHQRPDDGAAVFGAHMQLFAQRFERDFQIFDQRIGFVLAVEGVFVGVLNRVLGAVINFPQRSRQVRALQFGQGVGDQHGLHELLGHADVEKRARLFSCRPSR